MVLKICLKKNKIRQCRRTYIYYISNGCQSTNYDKYKRKRKEKYGTPKDDFLITWETSEAPKDVCQRKIRDAEGWVPKAPKEDFSEGGLCYTFKTPKNQGKFPNKLLYPLYLILILDFFLKQVCWNLYRYFCGLVLICI